MMAHGLPTPLACPSMAVSLAAVQYACRLSLLTAKSSSGARQPYFGAHRSMVWLQRHGLGCSSSHLTHAVRSHVPFIDAASIMQ